MKSSILKFATVLMTLFAVSDLFSQGVVTFNNTAETRITNSITGQLLHGTNTFRFGLYVGISGATRDQLSLLGIATNLPSTSPLDIRAGLFSGGSTTIPLSYGRPLTVQVRGWSLFSGDTYEDAYAAALGGDSSILLGESNLGLVFPEIPPGPATPLFSTGGPLFGFSLGPIPEPSSALLAVIGAMALWMRKRSRKCA